ncbi:unnamed protein product [Linum tenue]|uniref:Uncharacterized protein n=1 Tax=Linum tenue TaxID=586396 RepID=A0AAV0IP94_9ROSI|nr:unnamed protein product [Linum tenue]
MAQNNRPPNWKEDGDEVLCKVWIQISEDSSVGHYQSTSEFWRRFGVMFVAKGFGISRVDTCLAARRKTIQHQCGA